VGVRAVFDTNILVDHLLGLSQAKQQIESYDSRIISVITWMEIMVGANAKSELQTKSFLSAFTVAPISTTTAEFAVENRKKLKIKLPDAIILATAEEHECVLLTRNTKDFSESDPRIRVPYKV
jgi:predicted nucleic acid-binding protein